MTTAFLSDDETILAVDGRKANTTGRGVARRLWFSKTLPAAGLATGDTVQLGTIPPGVRVTGGQFCWSATQGATATTAIGVAGATDRYFTAAVTASAAVFRIADVQTQANGRVTTTTETILATNAAAAWAVNSVLQGYLDYVTV